MITQQIAPMRFLFLVLLLFPSLIGATTITGNLRDVSNAPYSAARVEFIPTTSAATSNTVTVIGISKSVAAPRGELSIDLVEGWYQVKFHPATNQITIYVPTSGTYTLAQVSTNLVSLWPPYSYVAGTNIIFGTNNNEITISSAASGASGGGITSADATNAAYGVIAAEGVLTNNRTALVSLGSLGLSSTLGVTGTASFSGDVQLPGGSGSDVIRQNGSMQLANGLLTVDTGGNVTAQSFSGDGSDLTALSGTAISSGTVADAWIASTIARKIEIGAMVATNNAAWATNWFGMTNYTQAAVQVNTNLAIISGAGTTIANGSYYWNGTQGTYTNANGSGFDYQFPPDVYITNGGSFLYAKTVGLSIAFWPDTYDGALPNPTGVWATNNYTGSGYRSSSGYLASFPNGISSSVGLFGSYITNNYGLDSAFGSGIFYTLDYPAFVGSSTEVTIDGPGHSVFSSRAITLNGQRVFVASSAHVDAVSTNADIAILSSEYLTVRQSDGIAAYIASANIGDDAPTSTAYTWISAVSVTNNGPVRNSTIINPGNGTYANTKTKFSGGIYDSTLINASASTNAAMVRSFLAGDYQRHTNVSDSTAIGSRLSIVNGTNVFLFGQGLTSTSNNVMKIGFEGWHLLIYTNRLAIVSNNVVHPITVP